MRGATGSWSRAAAEEQWPLKRPVWLVCQNPDSGLAKPGRNEAVQVTVQIQMTSHLLSNF